MESKELKKQIDHPDMLADTMRVEIVSAEKEIFAGRAKVVIASGEDGDLGVFPGHTQLLSGLKPGEVRLISKTGEEDYYYVDGGFIEVLPDIVTILADTVVRAEDIDEQRALEAKESAEEMLASRKKLDDYTEIMIELTKAIAQLRVAKHGRFRK